MEVDASSSIGERRVASAESLPFADREVVGYRAERLYQHLADPVACAAEALRILRSGGRLVLVDQDWDALVVDADDHDLTCRILRSFVGWGLEPLDRSPLQEPPARRRD
ncbi:MAG: methyltransferase domain-containing protein [Acidimicrobiia bacterium]|nr:methyltransferase domain-containing protein [Acidimicrobiia bacterium]